MENCAISKREIIAKGELAMIDLTKKLGEKSEAKFLNPLKIYDGLD